MEMSVRAIVVEMVLLGGCDAARSEDPSVSSPAPDQPQAYEPTLAPEEVEPPKGETRTVAWSEFAEYVKRQIWPHRLDDHSREVYQDIEGGEIPEFVVHVCTGINGFATLEDPDPDLVHAAFSTIFPNHELLGDEIRASFLGCTRTDEGRPLRRTGARRPARNG